MKKTYTVTDILAKAKEIFNLNTKDHATGIDDNMRIIRTIQRYTQKNITPVSTHGRTKFYSSEQVEQILYSEEGLHPYFVKLVEEKSKEEGGITLKTNTEYKFQIEETLDQSTLEFDDTLTKLELDLGDYLLLMEDNATNREYLNLEELEFLGKKGLFLREHLSTSESESLRDLYFMKDVERKQYKTISNSFQQKKMELMIEALFYREFQLDETLLLNDITYAYEAGNLGMPEPQMLKSIDRLKNFRFYCTPINNNQDEDEIL